MYCIDNSVSYNILLLLYQFLHFIRKRFFRFELCTLLLLFIRLVLHYIRVRANAIREEEVRLRRYR